MSQASDNLLERAEQLRAAFDRAFAAPPPGAAATTVDLLAIRCAEQPIALRMSEVLSIHTDRKIVPVPSPAPELLGLFGVRGLGSTIQIFLFCNYCGSYLPFISF